MMAPIICERLGRVGCVLLNKSTGCDELPIEGLTALNHTLSVWAQDPSIELVLFENSPEVEGIFLDGDAPALIKASRSLDTQALEYVGGTYRLCQTIAHFPKPVLTVLGGRSRFFNTGVGLNSSVRIATEKTSFSFPETGFGFIPDGGASLYLSRLKGELGTWLAMTGAKLKGAEVMSAGLATHLYNSFELPALKQALSNEGLKALKSAERSTLDGLIKQDEIATLFSGDCANIIKKNLEKGSDWAKSQATKFSAKSPIAIKIALRQLRTAKYLTSVNEALRIDYRIASRLIFRQSFREGVRAQYLDRDFCPWWRPQVVNAVTFDMVAEFFSPLQDNELDLPSVNYVGRVSNLMVAA